MAECHHHRLTKKCHECEAEAKGEPLDAAEQFEALGAEATMNEVLQKDPRDVSDDLLLRLVEVLRQERAMMIQKGER